MNVRPRSPFHCIWQTRLAKFRDASGSKTVQTLSNHLVASQIRAPGPKKNARLWSHTPEHHCHWLSLQPAFKSKVRNYTQIITHAHWISQFNMSQSWQGFWPWTSWPVWIWSARHSQELSMTTLSASTWSITSLGLMECSGREQRKQRCSGIRHFCKTVLYTALYCHTALSTLRYWNVEKCPSPRWTPQWDHQHEYRYHLRMFGAVELSASHPAPQNM